MPITLLNIDIASNRTFEMIEKSIYEHIDSIYELLDNFGDGDIPKPRMMILRNRMKDLQDAIADFGEETGISTNEKQAKIFELHPQLISLANDVYGRDDEVDYNITSCISYLLNLLCSGAAANPKSVVIGVSNILAQVLSQEVGVDELPVIQVDKEDPIYFSTFSTYYNYLLTSAGIYAAPVIGLPGITISALGNWTERSLRQFGFLRKFVNDIFNPQLFYTLDKRHHSVKNYDSTKDILASILYENEFLVQIAARADIISGIEFPKEFTNSDEPISFKSTDEITEFICLEIRANSKRIFKIIDSVYSFFQSAMINRNENPMNDKEFIHLRNVAEAWEVLADLGLLLLDIFKNNPVEVVKVEDRIGFPAFRAEDGPQSQLISLLHRLSDKLELLKGDVQLDDFIQSAEFTTYRIFFHYMLYIIAINDIQLKNNSWLEWFYAKYQEFFKEQSIEYTTLETLLLGELFVFKGFAQSSQKLLDIGKKLIELVESYVEFQTHHLVSIKILRRIIEMYENNEDFVENKDNFVSMINNFISTYEIPMESMLFYKLNIYIQMIDIYFQQNEEAIVKQYERNVPFDIFSWATLPLEFSKNFIWLPTNSAVENLNIG